jgi:hypothetical protein
LFEHATGTFCIDEDAQPSIKSTNKKGNARLHACANLIDLISISVYQKRVMTAAPSIKVKASLTTPAIDAQCVHSEALRDFVAQRPWNAGLGCNSHLRISMTVLASFFSFGLASAESPTSRHMNCTSAFGKLPNKYGGRASWVFTTCNFFALTELVLIALLECLRFQCSRPEGARRRLSRNHERIRAYLDHS